MKKRDIKYSIIMPVYNAINSIDKSISSIINQSYHNWEMIVVDDGSTDNSYKKIEYYSKLDNRIKVYYQENAGPGIARNYGIKNATGDYIAFLDADDYYEKSFLQVINDQNKVKNYDLIFISTINENKFGKKNYCDNLIKYSKYDKDTLIGYQMAGIIPWGPCSKVVKSSIVKQCKFSNFDVGEEALFSFDVLSKANEYFFIKKPMYHYVHTESGQHKKGGYEPWKPILDNMNKLLKEQDCYEKYEKYLNCLALKSLSIFIYRYSSKNRFLDSTRQIRAKKKEYDELYCLKNINYSILEKSTKVIIFFLNLKMYPILVLISKLRNKFKKMED